MVFKDLRAPLVAQEEPDRQGRQGLKGLQGRQVLKGQLASKDPLD
jgi:hypothetical protein